MLKTLCFIIIGLSFFYNVLSAAEHESEVVNDLLAKEGEFPFVVSLQSEARKHFCAGSLLTLSHILTSCTCINLFYENGASKSNNTFNNVAVGGGVDITPNGNNQVRRIRSIKKPSECQENFGMVNDYGLCETIDPFEEGPKLNVMKVFSWDKNELALKTDELTEEMVICRVLGWGARNDSLEDIEYYKDSDVLMKVNMYLTNPRRCKVDVCMPVENKCLTPDIKSRGQLCAFGCRNGNGCKGDLGGPIYCNGYVYGLLSWHFQCSKNLYPTMFSRIDYGLEFFVSLRSDKVKVANNKCSIVRSHMGFLSLLTKFIVFLHKK